MNARHFNAICNAVRPILNTDDDSLVAWVHGGWETEDDGGLNLVAWVAAARARADEDEAVDGYLAGNFGVGRN